MIDVEPRHRSGVWTRLVRGSRWAWVAPAYHRNVPPDLDAMVMEIDSRDRLNQKQGRSTARVRVDGPSGSVTGYLKRHYRVSWLESLAALVLPGMRVSPGAAEWSNLRQAQAIGIPVPAAVAAGERVGPGLRLQSYLLVEELADCLELHEALPRWHEALSPGEFDGLKRRLIPRMAEIAARLHRAHLFHKDLYLCHFFVPARVDRERDPSVTLIDLHRLRRHRLTAARWRLKDLGQLLFSTWDVPVVTNRDRLRFWKHYRKRARLPHEAGWRRALALKAERYRKHNRP